MNERKKFAAPARAPLAILRAALDETYAKAETETDPLEGIGVVCVSGPLEHHGGWWFDSYDSIAARVEEALAEAPRALVLRIDSPGGLASGMVECAKKIRRLAASAEVPVYAYADECAASAAYGLACAADEIWTSETGTIGSVGVIMNAIDRTEANRRAGLRVELITTGARKGDGDPDKPLDDGVRAALRGHVESFGRSFFALVATSRGMKPRAVRALEAGVFVGQAAVDAGLADGIASWDSFLDLVRLSFGGDGLAVRASKKSSQRAGKAARGNSAMSKKLQALQAVEKTKAAISAAKTDEERATAIAAFDAAHIEAAKYRKVVKHEERTTAEDEDDADDVPSKDDEEEDDEEDDEDGDEDSESGSSSAGSTDAEAAEEKAFFGTKVGLHTPERLLRLCRQATGVRSIAEVFGALSNMEQKMKSYDKLEARLVKLEGSRKSDKVDAMLMKALRAGQILPAQRASLRAMGMRSPGELKGFLATSPVRVRTMDVDSDSATEASANGAPTGSVLATFSREDQEVITAGARALGITPEENAKKTREKLPLAARH